MNWLQKTSQEIPDDPIPEQDIQRQTYQLPREALTWLDNKLNGLNKVAAKLNLDPVGYKILREWTVPDPNDEFGMRERGFVEIELYGESPRLKTPSGKTYKFLSRIMHTTEGNILKSIPGIELPEEYRTIAPRCQHCNYKRRRNDTYVLQDTDTGKLIQVGSTCLKDFLGHQSADSYASWAGALADVNIMLSDQDFDDLWGGGGGGRETSYGIERFLGMIYAYIKMYGWLGRAKARDMDQIASVDGALNMYHSKNKEVMRKFNTMMEGLTTEDKDMLAAALEWARELKDGNNDDIDSLSDYYWNLSLACSSPLVTPATSGIVASLPVAYNKAVLSKIQPNPTVVAGNKGELWIGRGVVEDENVYGDENSYRLRTEDNKLIQWSGSPIESAIGNTINIEGTIVGYSRYFQSVTTRLARVKVLSDEEFATKKNENVAPPDLGDAPEYHVGEKITVDVAILNVRDIESGYGTSTLYTMVDNWGNTLKWFNSGSISFEQGERLNITGTVKKLDEYKGQPQVVLTRCKVNSRELPEGKEDPRLPPQEEKALKSQYNKLKRALKTLQTTVGIVDQRDFNAQVGELFDPIRQNIEDIRYSVPQGELRQLDYHNILENFQNIGNIFEQYTPVALQKREQELNERMNQNPDPYIIQYMQKNLESLKGRIAQIPTNVANFQQNAPALLEKKRLWDEAKPEMDKLQDEIWKIEDTLRRHNEAVKVWGKRLAGANWLGKLCEVSY